MRVLRLLLLLTLLLLPRPVQAGHRHAWHYLGLAWTTGYVDRGLTASGALAGPGICATDWRVIPEGARIRVAGVETCRVLDTGVYGMAVDVWVPTVSQAYAITGWRRAYIWR